jgi:DNA-binding transcriptional MerR regulator/methylmalonyl-CoA mutase cobalamin-binding subunit
MERAYRIHVAAEMSGVSEALIRAWERRYGALKPRRSASGYRTYTEVDIEVLRRLKQLTEEGVSIAEASQLLPKLRREAKEHLDRRDAAPRVPKAQQLELWRQEILTAAERLDQQAVEAILDEALAALPAVAFFDEVLAPVQREIGDRWHRGRITVAEEHLVTQAVRQRVLVLLQQSPRRGKRHVVCACFPKEDHEVGLLGAALRFRHAGWRVTYLGARTPPEHLARVVNSLEPDLVALSVVADPGAGPFAAELDEVLGALPVGTKIVLGGPPAVRHRKAVEQHGATVVSEDDDWAPLLG